MTNNVAYVIERISSITGHAPVKKALQKTIFLLQTKGVDMGFEYGLHFYGPYCAELDHETVRLSSDGVVDFTYTQYGHRMAVDPQFSEEIEPDIPAEDTPLVDEVIKRYKEKKPSELELLTTAIYVHEYTDARTQRQMIENVKKIKGEKYSDAEIKWALGEFSYFGISL